MKTVLITGASHGIGKAIAKEFAQNGYNVVINYNSSKKEAEELSKEINGILVKADVCKENEVEQMFDLVKQKIGKIDVLVNNAGVALKQMVCDTSLQEWQKVLDINLTGTFLTSKYALKDMMYSGGKIINISSVFGLSGASCEGAYSAAKAGVIGLTKSMAKEYANVCVNCVCPGAIETKMNNNLSLEEKQKLIEEIPTGRLGTCEEVAKTILFLASDAADYITGQIISINGGMYI